MSEISEGITQAEELAVKEVKKFPRRWRLKRLLSAMFLGVTLGGGAVEFDHRVTDGLLTSQVRNLLVDPAYRSKLWESVTSGAVMSDLSDLLRAAQIQANSTTEATNPSETFEPTQMLGEILSIQDTFLDTHFGSYEIREVSSNEAAEKRPLYIAEIDRPTIVNFNEGSVESPRYDPWLTFERIGAFLTIPTNHSDPTAIEGERTHALYSAYSFNGEVVEYQDIEFSKVGEDPHRIRAGALVLFSQPDQSTLVALDSRDFNLQINDHTPNGTVTAIESFGAAISSAHEAEDINSFRQLRGSSTLPEYTRKNYQAVLVTYTFVDGSTETYALGLYTNSETLPDTVSPWPLDEELSPQDFYSLVRQYGQEQGAISWVMLLPDPGPSSYLYDQENVLGNTRMRYHSEYHIRPQYSLVQMAQ